MKTKLCIFFIIILSSFIAKGQYCDNCGACTTTITGTNTQDYTWSSSGTYCIAVGAVINGNVTVTGTSVNVCNRGTINGNVSYSTTAGTFFNTETGVVNGDFTFGGTSSLGLCNAGYIQTGELIITGTAGLKNYGILDLTGDVDMTGTGTISSYCGFKIADSLIMSGTGTKTMTGLIEVGSTMYISTGTFTLNIDGNLVIGEDFVINGTSTVTVNGMIDVTRDAVINKTLVVSGYGMEVGRDLTMDEDVTIDSLLTVGRNLIKTSSVLDVTGTMSVGGNTSLSGSGDNRVEINGHSTIGGNLDILSTYADYNVNGSLIVTGDTYLQGGFNDINLTAGSYFETNNLDLDGGDIQGPTTGTYPDVKINGTGQTSGSGRFDDRVNVCGSCVGCNADATVTFSACGAAPAVPLIPAVPAAPEDSCSSGITLPIELASFEVNCISGRVDLNWTTLTEINNNYFTVERSQDGINWQEVTRVNGAGNSNQLLSYKATDNNALIGTSYYRLKQTDFDGVFKYFPLESASCVDINTEKVLIYPNPSENYFGFIYSENVNELKLRITDVRGREVLLKDYRNIEGDVAIIVDVADLASGVYNVSFVTEIDFIHKKLVLK
ncbi:MAG: T9SS type A sorting domain-containing protein [Vicingus serpentipes]|nr:T9SS type A sorting domain-containing protein [Vicingus serpentipes]